MNYKYYNRRTLELYHSIKLKEKLKDFSETRLDKIKSDVKNAITGERFSLSEIDQEFMSKFKI